MNDNKELFAQVKQSIFKYLKHVSLQKKDQTFLINLIELFDLLSKDENEKFLTKLQKQIDEKKEDEINAELRARIYSLKTQLENQKYYEVKKFPHF